MRAKRAQKLNPSQKLILLPIQKIGCILCEHFYHFIIIKRQTDINKIWIHWNKNVTWTNWPFFYTTHTGNSSCFQNLECGNWFVKCRLWKNVDFCKTKLYYVLLGCLTFCGPTSSLYTLKGFNAKIFMIRIATQVLIKKSVRSIRRRDENEKIVLTFEDHLLVLYFESLLFTLQGIENWLPR